MPKTLIRCLPLLAVAVLAAAPAFAAEPSPSPKPLPIRGVTVDVQRSQEAAPAAAPNSHIERPPMFRSFRVMSDSANKMMAPAGAAAPAPTPTPTPAGHR